MTSNNSNLLGDSEFDWSNIILRDSFQFSQDGFQTFHIELYKQGIKVINQNGSIQSLRFDFEVKYTILRRKEVTLTVQSFGQPYGIKFERQPTQVALFAFVKSQQILSKWKQQLAFILNQRGFHDLYKPYKKIGKGNSATVYLAERYEDKMKMAIKAFSKQSLRLESKGKQSLINQINIMRQFDHPSLMKLYEVFETDNSYYLALEYLDGGQLFQKINRRRFNIQQIQIILRKLTQGLVQMHKHNIIHRDLKPQNLIFRKKNDCSSIVIADFGLATKEDQKQYIFVRCGTPGYVAPQIINFIGNSGQQTISDIFSLGVIAHILSTGRSPFTGRQYVQVLKQNKNANFNFDQQFYKQIDSSLLDLIKKMVTTKVQQRITAKDMLNHIFFQQQKIEIPTTQSIDQEDFLPGNFKEDKKGMQKIIDSRGSFIVAKPQILKGTDESYNSINNTDVSQRSPCNSPQSIRLPTTILGNKRQIESTSLPIDSQFKIGNRKKLSKARVNFIKDIQNKQIIQNIKIDEKQIVNKQDSQQI